MDRRVYAALVRDMQHFKSQSAMEYLMTYGWSILIIAVVLGALFQLGVFSSANFTPKAQPGNCRVLRVAGTANLEGTCTGVPPQSVAQFDGVSSYYLSSLTKAPTSAFTASLWVRFNIIPLPTAEQDLLFTGYGGNGGWILLSNLGTLSFSYTTGGTNYGVSCPTPTTSNWYFLTLVSTGSSERCYVNNIAGSPDSTVFSPSTTYVYTGTRWGTQYFFGGSIADVQIYNTSLDASQIQALYLKGIGAAPIDPNHIVGWWPLNGNANDYSGNNNGGAPTNIIYTSSWTSGYTPP
jgi:Concanavalin A-like lectin/glucanases superfamily